MSTSTAPFARSGACVARNPAAVAKFVIAFVTSVSLFLSVRDGFAQGSLTPPGAPTPTMKSLDQVASTGIALNATNTPGDASNHFVINQSGSYFLTGNLDVTKTNGIRVNVANVTIDLNGYQIARASGSGGDGITLRPAADGCTVTNGSITGFGNAIDTITTTARGCVFREFPPRIAPISPFARGRGQCWKRVVCMITAARPAS